MLYKVKGGLQLGPNETIDAVAIKLHAIGSVERRECSYLVIVIDEYCRQQNGGEVKVEEKNESVPKPIP